MLSQSPPTGSLYLRKSLPLADLFFPLCWSGDVLPEEVIPEIEQVFGGEPPGPRLSVGQGEMAELPLSLSLCFCACMRVRVCFPKALCMLASFVLEVSNI